MCWPALNTKLPGRVAARRDFWCGCQKVVLIIGMNHVKEGVKDFAFNDPIAQAAIERFLESADYEFECSKIVGRKFENVADHARYLRAGGCSKIVEASATPG